MVTAVDRKARELKSFMTAAGITMPESIIRVLTSQIGYIDDYTLTDDEKALFVAAATKIIESQIA